MRWRLPRGQTETILVVTDDGLLIQKLLPDDDAEADYEEDDERVCMRTPLCLSFSVSLPLCQSLRNASLSFKRVSSLSAMTSQIVT